MGRGLVTQDMLDLLTSPMEGATQVFGGQDLQTQSGRMGAATLGGSYFCSMQSGFPPASQP